MNTRRTGHQGSGAGWNNENLNYPGISTIKVVPEEGVLVK